MDNTERPTGNLAQQAEGMSFRLPDLINQRGQIVPRNKSEEVELQQLYKAFGVEPLGKKYRKRQEAINKVEKDMPILACTIVSVGQAMTIKGICRLVNKQDLWPLYQRMKTNREKVRIQQEQELVIKQQQAALAKHRQKQGTTQIPEGIPVKEGDGVVSISLDQPIMPQADEPLEFEDQEGLPEEPTPEELKQLVGETLGMNPDEVVLPIEPEGIAEEDPGEVVEFADKMGTQDTIEIEMDGNDVSGQEFGQDVPPVSLETPVDPEPLKKVTVEEVAPAVTITRPGEEAKQFPDASSNQAVQWGTPK